MWDETCAITHTPILEGKCVMLVINREKHLHDLFPSMIMDYQYIDILKRGTYNQYGWIKEIPEDENDEFWWNKILDTKFRVFFHEIAWDNVVEFMQNKKNPMYEIVKNFPHESEIEETIFNEFLMVSAFCHTSRKTLLTNQAFSGQQDYKTDDYHKLIADLILEQCQEMKKHWDD